MAPVDSLLQALALITRPPAPPRRPGPVDRRISQTHPFIGRNGNLARSTTGWVSQSIVQKGEGKYLSVGGDLLGVPLGKRKGEEERGRGKGMGMGMGMGRGGKGRGRDQD
jgi:hypothetical protein